MPLVQRGEIYVVHYIPHMPLLIRSKQQLELGGKQPHHHPRFNPTSAYKHLWKLTASKNHHDCMTARLPWIINITTLHKTIGKKVFFHNYLIVGRITMVLACIKEIVLTEFKISKVDNCSSVFFFFFFSRPLALLQHSSVNIE